MALSPQHEALVELFRHRPALAVDLLAKGHGLHLSGTVAPLPADATQLQPAERRADLVMRVEAPGGGSVGLVVEVQLQPDEAKRWSWPVYLSGLRERHRHGVVLLVLTLHRATARWARRAIELGHPGFVLHPLVVGPDEVPVVQDPERARADPELAVLSAMAHGRGPAAERVGRAALSAVAHLDDERARLYADLVLLSARAATRRFLEALMNQPYEFQSDFARRYIARGREEGLQEGREEGLRLAVVRLAARRFPRSTGPLEELLPRCDESDLTWLLEELVDARSGAVVARDLQRRLDARGAL